MTTPPIETTPGTQIHADRPRVPRTGFGKLAIALAVVGTAIVGGYGAVAYADFEPNRPERDEIPASVRSSPGGYRTHTWHGGYHGGK